MVKSVGNLRSKRDASGRTIFFRLRTDSKGFKGKIQILVGDKSLPDVDTDIAGQDSTLFDVSHSETGQKVVKVTADNASTSVVLNLDLPKDPA